MGINKIILSIILTFCLIIIFFIGSFLGLLFDNLFYDKLYFSTGAYDRIDNSIVENKTNELYGFFKSENELDNNFYTENELSHMHDVREIIKNVSFVYYFSIIIFLVLIILAYMYYRPDFVKIISLVLIYSGAITILLIFLFYLTSFTDLFGNFHKLFFDGNYSFSASSNLIRMYSEQFFYLFAKKILTVSLIKGVVGLGLGLLILSAIKYNHR